MQLVLYSDTWSGFIKTSADMMNIETWLSMYSLDQFVNSATPNNECDYDLCTNIMFNHVLESYIHIVLRRENLEAITENKFTFDEVGSICIGAHKQNIGVLVWKQRQT